MFLNQSRAGTTMLQDLGGSDPAASSRQPAARVNRRVNISRFSYLGQTFAFRFKTAHIHIRVEPHRRLFHKGCGEVEKGEGESGNIWRKSEILPRPPVFSFGK